MDGYGENVTSPNPWTIKGTLKKIKEDQRMIVYNLTTSLKGLSGSVYIHSERGYDHLWDRIVLEKDEWTKG